MELAIFRETRFGSAYGSRVTVQLVVVGAVTVLAGWVPVKVSVEVVVIA